MPHVEISLPTLGEDPWGPHLLTALQAFVDAFNSSLSSDVPLPLGPVAVAGSTAGPGAPADHVHPNTGLATVADLENAVITGGGTPPQRLISTGAGLAGGGDLTTDRTLSVVFGTTSGTAMQGDDARVGGAVQAATTAGTGTGYVLTVQVTGDLVSRYALRADGTRVSGEPPLTVSNVTGTSTVTVTTSTNHGYGTGDVVTISGVQSYTGANGTFTITRTSATQFTLNSATGSGTYTTGGTVQRSLGGTGSTIEGAWNFLLPDTTRDGLVIRGRESSTGQLLTARDYTGAVIAAIAQVGGFGVYGDKIFTTTNVFGRAFIANENGGFRAAAGDPAGGVDVFALGNAATPPTANPDGTHTGEGSFATAEGVVLWSRNGRLRLRTSTGHEDDLLSRHERVTYGITATGGVGSFQTWGCSAPTVTSSPAAAATDSSTGNQVQISTTSTSGNVGNIIPGSGIGTHTRPWLSPHFFARFGTDTTITSLRIIVALGSADISGNAGPASTGAYTTAAGAWFRYDTSVDGTAFWRCVTSSGTNATVTTTSVAVAANTVYNGAIEIDSAGTSIRFRIDGVLVATHTTNLPSSSQTLGYQVAVTTLTTAARLMRLNHLQINQE